jgi:hypothetical protein
MPPPRPTNSAASLASKPAPAAGAPAPTPAEPPPPLFSGLSFVFWQRSFMARLMEKVRALGGALEERVGPATTHVVARWGGRAAGTWPRPPARRPAAPGQGGRRKRGRGGRL